MRFSFPLSAARAWMANGWRAARRACPGRAFGDASVWLAAVRILAVFDLAKARNRSTGAIVEFEPEFVSGMIRCVGVRLPMHATSG